MTFGGSALGNLPRDVGVGEVMLDHRPTAVAKSSLARWAIAVPVCMSLVAPLMSVAAQKTDHACDFSRFRRVLRMGLVDPQCVLVQVEPTYPLMAKHAHVSGDVVVRVLVNRAGKVVAVCLVSGHPLLRAAALDAAKQWRFRKNFCLSLPQPRGYLDTTIRFRFSRGSHLTPPN